MDSAVRWFVFVLSVTCIASFTTCSVRFRGDFTRSASVGIDLGTTYSLVSVVKSENSSSIVPIEGSRSLPSVVAYLPSAVLVGNDAKAQQVENPVNTYSSVKRLIGRTNKQVVEAGESALLPKLVGSVGTQKGSNKKTKKTKKMTMVDGAIANEACLLKTSVSNREDGISPVEISSHIIRTLIDKAQEHLGDGEKIDKAVITVPAYFDEYQRQATEKAAEMAGIQKVKLLREPEAAALAYGLLQRNRQIVLVFDLGGGTFDVSVLEVGDGFVEVIATSGDGHLGGDDFDEVLVEWMKDQFKQQWPSHAEEFNRYLRSKTSTSTSTSLDEDEDDGIDGIDGSNQLERLRMLATGIKIQLSKDRVVTVEVPSIYNGMDLAPVNITRGKFESLCKPLFARLLKPLREVAIMSGINLPGESGQAGLTDDMFDDDLFQDGDDEDQRKREVVSSSSDSSSSSSSSSSPASMRRMQLDGRREARARKKMQGSSTKELRRLQKSLGDPSLALFPGGQALDEVILVGGATRMTAIGRLVKAITAVEPKRSVNPDEAVCIGAGIWAGILDGTIKNMQVMSSLQAALYRAFREEKEKGNTKGVDFFERIGMEETAVDIGAGTSDSSSGGGIGGGSGSGSDSGSNSGDISEVLETSSKPRKLLLRKRKSS